MSDQRGPLVSVEGLRKQFVARARTVNALNGVDLSIEAGETLGVVGESGCGKTTLGRCLVGLLRPTSGSVSFGGENLASCSPRRLRELRAHFQILFQDPAAALNPSWTVRRLLTEPLKLHDLGDHEARVSEVLDDVGLDPNLLGRRPHELSGGQRQRVALARTIVTRPQFIVLDEPTASVDMAMRVSLLGLLKRLQMSNGISYLLISHDLATVRQVCDRVQVMYLGKVVERGAATALFGHPMHVYTQTLLDAVPRIGGGSRQRGVRVLGEPPSPTVIPAGCPFRPRCPMAGEECLVPQPFFRLGSQHEAACCLADPRRIDSTALASVPPGAHPNTTDRHQIDGGGT